MVQSRYQELERVSGQVVEEREGEKLGGISACIGAIIIPRREGSLSCFKSASQRGSMLETVPPVIGRRRVRNFGSHHDGCELGDVKLR